MGVAVYLAFPISYRDLALMLSDRGVSVDHTTLYRWVQAYAATLEQRVRRHLRPCTDSWRVDETCIKVKGVWTYLYRAVDSLGQTIDFRSPPEIAAISHLARSFSVCNRTGHPMAQQGVDINAWVGQQPVHLLDCMFGQASPGQRQTLADYGDRKRGRLDYSDRSACQRKHALGMQVSRKQRSQKLVDALERERLLGWHSPASCIVSQGLEPHLGPACKVAQPLITTGPSGNPARTVARFTIVSIVEAE